MLDALKRLIKPRSPSPKGVGIQKAGTLAKLGGMLALAAGGTGCAPESIPREKIDAPTGEKQMQRFEEYGWMQGELDECRAEQNRLIIERVQFEVAVHDLEQIIEKGGFPAEEKEIWAGRISQLLIDIDMFNKKVGPFNERIEEMGFDREDPLTHDSPNNHPRPVKRIEEFEAPDWLATAA